MRLAGIDVDNDLVTVLVSLLRDDIYVNPADKLDVALAQDQPEVALSINDRNAILDVLDDPPTGLDVLHAVLLSEYTWRVQHGFESRPPVG